MWVKRAELRAGCPGLSPVFWAQACFGVPSCQVEGRSPPLGVLLSLGSGAGASLCPFRTQPCAVTVQFLAAVTRGSGWPCVSISCDQACFSPFSWVNLSARRQPWEGH